MSAYIDWKCGALSDDEYTFACNREAAMDKAYEEREEQSEHYSCVGCKHIQLPCTQEPCYSCRNGLCTENLNRTDKWEDENE